MNRVRSCGAALGLMLLSPLAAADSPDEIAAAQRSAFDRLDADASGGVSLAELLANVPADQQAEEKRRFLVMDFNADGDLTFSEYLALRGVDVPDPWNELSEAAFTAYRTIVEEADENKDGTLSRKEWPKELVAQKLPGFGTKTFSQWDANQDGQVTEDEARRMIDVGYALRLPTGDPARWPNGSVLYWSHLRDVDRNRDGAVSRAEFVAKHGLGKEQNEALFPELDHDGDSQLSSAEISKSAPFLVNVVSRFYEFDSDRDGRLSPEELAEHCPPAQKNPRGLELGMAAFDDDGDGQYSLREFRLSPVGALHLTVPLLNAKDANQDGAISFKEFTSKSSPLFAGVAGEVFSRYDRDHDGQLTHDEYDFPEDPELKQQVLQHAPQVRAMLAAELHYFLTISPVSADQRAVLKPFVRRAFDKVTRQLAVAQRQLNRGFDSNRPPAMPDPQTLFSQEFARFAEDHLTAESAAKYRQEIDQREAHRRQATVHILVARLDRDLLLNPEQREAISRSLLDKWQPLWAQQIEFMLQNEQQLLALPDACVAPQLTDQQKTVWQALPKSTYFGWNFGGGVFQVGGAAAQGGPNADLLPVLEAPEPQLEGAAIEVLDAES